MVHLTDLWLPILLSAVFVFIVSSIFHTVLQLHRKDYRKLPEEDKVLEAMRAFDLPPGNYSFPRPDSAREFGSPQMKEKFNKGPVGMMTVLPSGPPAMGKSLVLWFVFCLVISLFVAYLTGRTLGAGVHYLAVFRVAGVTGFLAYGAAHAVNSIWKGDNWGMTIQHTVDGLVYGLVTAGTFGWLWPD